MGKGFWEGNGLGWGGGWAFKIQNNSGLGGWDGLRWLDGVDGLGGVGVGQVQLESHSVNSIYSHPFTSLAFNLASL